MKLFFAFCGISMILAAAAHAASDPRKCDAGRRTGDEARSFCGHTSATLALRRHMAAVTGASNWDNSINCAPTSATFLVWSCPFGISQGTGTVTFRALANGWHTRVTVVCADPSKRPAGSCL